MSKTLIFILGLSFSLLSSQNCQSQKIKGSGNVVTQSRGIVDFTGIRTRSIVQVELTQGAFKIEIEAEDNIQEYVETRLVKENLVIEIDEEVKFKSEKPVKVYVQMPEINFIEVSEASGFSAKSVFKTPELTIEANGATKSNFIIDTKMLRIRLSGAADVRATGYAVKQNIKAEEASHYEASQLKSEDIDLAGGSASKIEILAFNNIFGDLSEAAECKYYGEPKKVDVSTSDAAKLMQQK